MDVFGAVCLYSNFTAAVGVFTRAYVFPVLLQTRSRTTSPGKLAARRRWRLLWGHNPRSCLSSFHRTPQCVWILWRIQSDSSVEEVTKMFQGFRSRCYICSRDLAAKNKSKNWQGGCCWAALKRGILFSGPVRTTKRPCPPRQSYHFPTQSRLFREVNIIAKVGRFLLGKIMPTPDQITLGQSTLCLTDLAWTFLDETTLAGQIILGLIASLSAAQKFTFVFLH